MKLAQRWYLNWVKDKWDFIRQKREQNAFQTEEATCTKSMWRRMDCSLKISFSFILWFYRDNYCSQFFFFCKEKLVVLHILLIYSLVQIYQVPIIYQVYVRSWREYKRKGNVEKLDRRFPSRNKREPVLEWKEYRLWI